MRARIVGRSCIGAQESFGTGGLTDPAPRAEEFALRAREPAYAPLLPGLTLRRLARSVKMGLATAQAALREAGVARPDAICTGTGLGCLEESQRFLLAMSQNDEQFLTPTAFAQSTQNTVGSQISLFLACHGYNTTYAHRAFSFESALMDALMLLDERQAQTVLCCGVDEFTEKYAGHRRTAGHLRPYVSREDFLEARSPGAPMGEGACCFVLTSVGQGGLILRGLELLYRPQALEERVLDFLARSGVSLEQVGLLLLGLSGDSRFDGRLRALASRHPQVPQGIYKHLCGEFHTAAAFGLWAGCGMLEAGGVPEAYRSNRAPERPLRHVLMVSGAADTEYSLVLLSRE